MFFLSDQRFLLLSRTAPQVAIRGKEINSPDIYTIRASIQLRGNTGVFGGRIIKDQVQAKSPHYSEREWLACLDKYVMLNCQELARDYREISILIQ